MSETIRITLDRETVDRCVANFERAVKGANEARRAHERKQWLAQIAVERVILGDAVIAAVKKRRVKRRGDA